MPFFPIPFILTPCGNVILINTIIPLLFGIFNVRQAQPTDIIKSAQEAARLALSSFDNIWVELVSGHSQIYLIIVRISLAFATIFIAFWAVPFFSTLSEGRFNQRSLEQLVPVLIIVLMLSLGQGAIPANISKTINDTISNTDNRILQQTLGGVAIEQTIQATNSNQTFKKMLTGKVRECQTQINSDKPDSAIDPNTQDLQNQCIENAFKDVTKPAQEYKEQNQGGDWWQIDFDVNQIAVDAFNEVILAVLEIILSAFQMGFVFLIQICTILNAYIAPIFLALSLLPGQVKLIHAWLSGWLALGLVKISYTIIVGLATTAMVNSEQSNVLLLPLLQGLLSPILALGIASGGGLALFNGLTSVSSGGLRFLIRTSQTPQSRSNKY